MPLWVAYRVVLQSGYLVSIEDLVPDIHLKRKDQPDSIWKPRKLKTTRKIEVEGKKIKKHYRRDFFKDLDII